ncbi:MAG: AI-2E family transporter [Undibacterium sp.]|nr:AI-2E family transporter [Undibacterium sp.]
MLLLNRLGPILTPFVVAATFAYALNPWVDQLARFKLGRWTVPRPLAAALVIVLMITVVLTLLLILVPIFQKEIPQLQNQIPLLVEKLNGALTPILHDLGIENHFDAASIKALVSEHLSSSGEAIAKGILSSIKVGGAAVLGLIANLVLIPVVLFYLLMDWNALIARIKNLLPRRWSTLLLSLANEVDTLLAQYLRGQVMVMIILAAYYSLGLSIAGFDLAIPVGVLTGLLVVIPYLGFGFGLFLAMISAALQFNNLHGLISVAIVYGFGQVLEGFFLTPKLVGERIGLHPLTVIFALMAFGQLFGFIGILVALPLAAVVSVGIKHLRSTYLASSFYSRNQ